jgi:DNA polymerase-3 subunit gamma/tau
LSYVVLARKYRPQTFSGLTGQEHVSRTLQNAIETGRIAHAFLFTGARGVGKTSSARILAKALNCEQGMSTEPCNACPACKEITEGNSTDVFEIDGASNTGVDDVRELRDNIRYLPSHSRYKIFIIDEVHMLSTNAFNALLKTLEEPPPHVKFIFATTEPHKVPVTILSRCQRLDFRRISMSKLVARLRFIADEERITISDTALNLIARKGDGSMRDSLSVFDQVLAFCGDNVGDEDVATLVGVVDRRLLADISSAVVRGETEGVLAGIKRVDTAGYSMRQFCRELIDHFRNLLMICSLKKPEEILDLAEAELHELRLQADGLSSREVQRCLALCIRAESEMSHATFPRLILEIALLKAATLEPVVPIQDLLDRLKALETSTVHAPDLSWEVPRPVPPAPAAGMALQEERPHLPPDLSPLPEPTLTQGPGGGSHSIWERFVAFALERRPAIGSVLEHGTDLTTAEEAMVIGFPKKSYYLTAAQDTDFIADVRALAREFTGREIAVTVKPIIARDDTAPLSPAEKKKRDQNQRLEELKREVTAHPVINEAIRVFGADITEIREN